MKHSNVAAASDLSAQMAALIAPMQGAGKLLQVLAEKLSASVGGGEAKGAAASSALTQTQGGVDGKADTVKDGAEPKTAVANFFNGLFESVNAQFSGFFTKLFGGGEDGGGLFGALGGLFGGKKDGEEGKDTGAETEAVSVGAEKIAKAGEEGTNDKKKQDADKVKSDAKAWGAMVGNALAGSKKLKKIQNAAAIASVIVSTATGIAKAFADNGFPGGIIPAAIIAAKGAAEIKAIKGQAHDGINNIPSTGTYLLERGERVVDSRLNTDLTGFLKAQTGARGGTRVSNSTVNRNQSASVTNAPVINLSFGAGTDENTVSSNRGAMESMIREIFADYAMEAPFG
jgi:hypothetical protein